MKTTLINPQMKTADGLVTVDHTRATLALELGIDRIPARIHQPTDVLPKSMTIPGRERFGSSKTWGEAIEYRASTQVPPLPPTGTTIPPTLPKSKVKT
jgi:filamentous hemagglutinin